jgi:hypothetical protein
MLYEITVPQFIKFLHNLSGLMDKAAQFCEAKKIEMDVLLNSRLYPDQFNFIRQVQITCDTAKLGVSRLTGKEAPSHPDTEKTMSELKSRIDSTISYLETFSAQDFKDSANRHITHSRWEGQYLTGDDFVNNHALPNFYFHIATAYSILRHNGVEVGKKDYLGKMPFKK